MTKITYFGPNLAVLGPKIQIFTRGINSFGSKGKLTKAPCSHCFLVGQGIIWAKNAKFGQKCQIWPFLGQKS